MKNELITSSVLQQSYRRIEHSSGLTILLCPMEGFSTAYALFAAKVGSIDTTFKTQQEEDFVTVPSGIAHFLEHKMFESEEGDAFAQYAKTGASANAYTSVDRTAYLFSCTVTFRQTMEILLKQVTTPYFTQQTVEKEQGIIGQEIRMYDDEPSWRVMFNLFEALFHENPIKLDIAGTVESIAEISAELLHRCYRTFYHLNNMVLAVAGNFQEADVLELADQILKPAAPQTIRYQRVPEPREVVRHNAEQTLSVAAPLFEIGFKGLSGDSLQNLKTQVVAEVLMEILCGESSPLYRRLYDAGLINSTFEYEVLSGRDYLIPMYGGESRDPAEVYRQLTAEIVRVTAEGIDRAAFERCRKATYGRYISMYCKSSSVAGLLVLSHFSGVDSMYDLLEQVRTLEYDRVTDCLKTDFDPQYSALSVINPA
ncbi:MAG: pitrilysin family protein [Angelakisella sp.]